MFMITYLCSDFDVVSILITCLSIDSKYLRILICDSHF